MSNATQVIVEVVDVISTKNGRVVLALRALHGTPMVGAVFCADEPENCWQLRGISFGPPGRDKGVLVVTVQPLKGGLPQKGRRYASLD